jgi:predicted anti-sigma-YlaC factor YlaD
MSKELNMNCGQIRKNLVNYYEGLLSAEKMKEMREHMEGCSSCALLYTKVSNTYLVFDRVKAPDLSFDLINKIEARIKKHSMQVSFERFTINRFVSKVAATVIIIIGIGLGILVGGEMEYIRTANKNVGMNEAFEIFGDEYSLTESGQSLEALLTNE